MSVLSRPGLMKLSIYIKEISLFGKLSMKIIQAVRGFLTTIRSYTVSSSRWRLAAVFISGMVLTAAAAQALVFADELTHPIVPVPQNTPNLYEPGTFPDKNPAQYRITELVYAFSGEALISS